MPTWRATWACRWSKAATWWCARQRLYLKTVEGLEPVHGMLRRLDDDWCDPLELRADSALGVPGLLQAVRAGNVVMANALGDGFLESPAIQGFLPGIARRLLGQELLLPALPTWWCGEAAAWHDVRAQLDDKIVRSTFPRERPARRWSRRPDDGAHRRRPRRLDRDREACASRAHRYGVAAPPWRALRWCACMPSPTAAAAGMCCPAA